MSIRAIAVETARAVHRAVAWQEMKSQSGPLRAGVRDRMVPDHQRLVGLRAQPFASAQEDRWIGLLDTDFE